MGASFKHITSRIGTVIAADGTGDLQVCFGSSQKSKYWYFVTNAANINKWARFKPFRTNASYNDHYDSTNSARLAAAAAVNYGLSAPSGQSNFLNTMGNSWPYANPRGTSYNEPLRVQDFEGYNGDAAAPVDPPGAIDISLSSGASFSFGAYIAHTQAGGDTIAWEDLPASVGNYYLCVIFSKNANFTGDLLAKTSSQKISNTGLTLDITHSELEQLRNSGYGYYYIVARSVTLSGLVSPGTNSATYLALPAPNDSNDLKNTITIRAAAVASVTISKYATAESPTRALQFFSASNYVGPESTPYDPSDYLLQSTAPYWFHLALDITAGSSAFTIGNAKLALSQTFNSGSGFSTPVNCTLYNSSFSQQTQITIPAGTTQTVYLVAAAPLLGLNQDGTRGGAAADQYFATRVKVYNGNTMIDQSNEIRVRNY